VAESILKPHRATPGDRTRRFDLAQEGESGGLRFRRAFTRPDVHPYDECEWEVRDAVIKNWRDGSTSFEQLGVEFPAAWSMNATTIVAQKYFRGRLGSPERERSVQQMIDRVVDTITRWGREGAYFADEESAEIFNAELKHLLVQQKASFNSPVWFNVGAEPAPQCSACFILAVDDTIPSILNWYAEEGIIFKGGSGSGVNLSTLRSSKEHVKAGGHASGPVSFMRGADASAGTIKSGGRTRRAAKMVILNADHPDVEDFIWTKAREERKARALREAGFDMDLDGKDSYSLQYQNANNSVRVSDEFMDAYETGRDYALKAVTTGETIERKSARDVMRQIAQAAWECADPGMQYDTTINDWHTCPASGRINASNPCSEYMHLDNSACNLASLNLKKFYDYETDRFDIEAFRRAIELIFTAQEIVVGFSAYPTEKIRRNAVDYRELGLGYANLGGLLMSLGLPYDSEAGRAWAAALTALLSGVAYRTSAELAAAKGPFAGYPPNRDAMLRVIQKHRAATMGIEEKLVPREVLEAARKAWDEALELGTQVGYRNSQATVLAPTGTIGLMMDCDTTGIEPDLGLVKTKKLVGGGSMSIVNRTVPQALARLGYSPEETDVIVAYVDEHKTILEAPGLRDEDLPVFSCAMGDNAIHYMGHVRMMAAVQPFISGAISKTVNMPEEVTVEDVERLYYDAWKMGLKAIAIYRDNCKVAQPLSIAKKKDGRAAQSAPAEPAGRGMVRKKLPKARPSQTISFRVGDAKGYLTAGEYPENGLGEIFVKLGKQGSTLSGLIDAFAISVSLGLQYGVPLQAYVSKFMNMRFDPAGMTDDEEIRFAHSIIDYLARKLAIEYLPVAERRALGIHTVAERKASLEGNGHEPGEADLLAAPAAAVAAAAFSVASVPSDADAPLCFSCGIKMKRAGSCHVCESCGATSGCS
jgi:ribonucleoside-diphosphate reductase alpha chain